MTLIKIGPNEFEQSDKFKYLGNVISSDGERTPEIQKYIKQIEHFIGTKRL